MEELFQIIVLEEEALGVDLEAFDDSVPLLHLQIHRSPFHLPHLNFLLRSRCLLPPPPPPLLRPQLLQTGLIFCVLCLQSLHSLADQRVGDQEEGLREAERKRRGEENFFTTLTESQ